MGEVLSLIAAHKPKKCFERPIWLRFTKHIKNLMDFKCMGGRVMFLIVVASYFVHSAFAVDNNSYFSSSSVESHSSNEVRQHQQVNILAATQYSFTGGVQTIIVPAGAITMVATLYGASGGINVSPGGKGGKIAASIPVSSGETYYLHIGGAASGVTPGWNGGGAGYDTYTSGGGGGTDLRRAGNTLNDRILVAGGGGGASGNCPDGGYPGGGGGYPSGSSGLSCYSFGLGGPGTANSGGQLVETFTYCPPSSNGGFGYGGSACIGEYGAFGGAGGGGWYGGAGAYAEAGGGGSSYSYYAVSTYTNDANTGNGYASIDFIYAPPTAKPISSPTYLPTYKPSESPTKAPTRGPTVTPTVVPTSPPTFAPTCKPSSSPTFSPTVAPTCSPTMVPTNKPTVNPTCTPTAQPTCAPTCAPTVKPT